LNDLPAGRPASSPTERAQLRSPSRGSHEYKPAKSLPLEGKVPSVCEADEVLRRIRSWPLSCRSIFKSHQCNRRGGHWPPVSGRGGNKAGGRWPPLRWFCVRAGACLPNPIPHLSFKIPPSSPAANPPPFRKGGFGCGAHPKIPLPPRLDLPAARGAFYARLRAGVLKGDVSAADRGDSAKAAYSAPGTGGRWPPLQWFCFACRRSPAN